MYYFARPPVIRLRTCEGFKRLAPLCGRYLIYLDGVASLCSTSYHHINSNMDQSHFTVYSMGRIAMSFGQFKSGEVILGFALVWSFLSLTTNSLNSCSLVSGCNMDNKTFVPLLTPQPPSSNFFSLLKPPPLSHQY